MTYLVARDRGVHKEYSQEYTPERREKTELEINKMIKGYF